MDLKQIDCWLGTTNLQHLFFLQGPRAVQLPSNNEICSEIFSYRKSFTCQHGMVIIELATELKLLCNKYPYILQDVTLCAVHGSHDYKASPLEKIFSHFNLFSICKSCCDGDCVCVHLMLTVSEHCQYSGVLICNNIQSCVWTIQICVVQSSFFKIFVLPFFDTFGFRGVFSPMPYFLMCEGRQYYLHTSQGWIKGDKRGSFSNKNLSYCTILWSD